MLDNEGLDYFWQGLYTCIRYRLCFATWCNCSCNKYICSHKFYKTKLSRKCLYHKCVVCLITSVLNNKSEITLHSSKNW